MEVRTPVLGSAGVSDPHIENLTVNLTPTGYLQSSPEYAMKDLIARHQQSIYQICPAFRGAESGSRHRIEFEMLEWYRVGYSLEALMDDVQSLMDHLTRQLSTESELPFRPGPIRKTSYRALFESTFGINPHGASLDQLLTLTGQGANEHLEDPTIDDCLDALFVESIEPGLSDAEIVFDFPASQAALAETRITEEGDHVAHRFELYLAGLEVANAYQELRDGDELARRLDGNNERRRQLGKPVILTDSSIQASTASLPVCAGIALGVDRLAMALTGVADIAQVQP